MTAPPVAPDPIPEVPDPVPQRSDWDNFPERGDEMMTWFVPGMAAVNTMRTYFISAMNWVVTKLNEITALANSATASEQASAANAAAAAASANAVLWVTGTNYPVPSSVVAGARVYSPTDQMVYVDTEGGLSNTDPAADTTGRWISGMLPSTSAIGFPSITPMMSLIWLYDLESVGVTYTRAMTKTRVDHRGLLVTDAAGTLGASYDPATLEPLGKIISPQTAYLAVYSEAIAANWTPSNVTPTDGSALGIDGALSMTKVLATTTATGAFTRQVTATATTQYYVVRVKKGSGAAVMNLFGVHNISTATDLIFATINYDTGVVTDSVGTGVTARDVGHGIYEVTIPCIAGVAIGNTLQLYLCCSGGAVTAGDFAYVSHPQISDKPKAPYHPTTGSTVTRPADLPVILGPDFDDNWNPRRGSIIAKVLDSTAASTRVICEISNGTTNDRYTLYMSGGNVLFNIDVAAANVASAQIAGAVATDGQQVIVVASWDLDAGEVRLAMRGHAVATDTVDALPTVDRLTLGALFSAGTYELGGPMQFVQTLPRAILEAEMYGLVNNT